MVTTSVEVHDGARGKEGKGGGARVLPKQSKVAAVGHGGPVVIT